MPSPAKKRKLADNAKSGQPRGLEYFFSKQRESPALVSRPGGETGNGGSKQPPDDTQDEAGAVKESLPVEDTEMTDEELARKLQAEWDEELRQHQEEQQQQQQQVVPALKEEEIIGEADSEPNKSKDIPTVPVSNTLSLQSVTTADDLITATIPLDQSPLTFDTASYIPLLKKQWQGPNSTEATYSLLTRCFVLVNATQSRIKIVDTLVNCLRLLIEADPGSARRFISQVHLKTRCPSFLDI